MPAGTQKASVTLCSLFLTVTVAHCCNRRVLAQMESKTLAAGGQNAFCKVALAPSVKRKGLALSSGRSYKIFPKIPKSVFPNPWNSGPYTIQILYFHFWIMPGIYGIRIKTDIKY